MKKMNNDFYGNLYFLKNQSYSSLQNIFLVNIFNLVYTEALKYV